MVVVLEEIKTLVPASFVIGSYVESCSREKANAISDLESRISNLDVIAPHAHEIEMHLTVFQISASCCT